MSHNSRTRVPKPINEPVCSYAPGSAERNALKSELERQSKEAPLIPIVIGSRKITDRPSHPIFSPQKKTHPVALVQSATESDIKAAIDAAKDAREHWASLPWESRAAVFLKAADLLSFKYRPMMNAATMLAQSKTCQQAEIDATCELADFFRFNAKFAEKIYSEQPPHSPYGMWNQTTARALEGFVYAIGPFNFSSISVNLATAPALMGCSVLWKPAHQALPASYVGLKILEEAGLPPGVINMVSGDASLISKVALNHKDLAGIHFTGSTPTFQSLWRTVGENISNYRDYPRLVGETGGKDFVFAHPSANIPQLVTALVRGAFEYQGQKCSAASRAYIPKSLWPQVKPLLADTVNSLKMGDPEDFTNFVNAVIDARAFAKIKSYIDHAKESNQAEILCGGECDDSVGYFIRPTVIVTSDPFYRSMCEEIFGPVLSIFVYDDHAMEETLNICDKTSPYALTGAIFAQDRHDIAYMTQRLEYAAGNFYINDKPTGAVVGQQPFGGSRGSGTNDKAGSTYNLLRWVAHRTIKENFLPITDYRYPHLAGI